jgi:PleD family two-component response regulator
VILSTLEPRVRPHARAAAPVAPVAPSVDREALDRLAQDLEARSAALRAPVGPPIPGSVLIVDEDCPGRAALAHAFCDTADVVLTVEGLSAAREALLAFTPQTIVTELDLRDGSGLELARLVRARHGNDVVIALTSPLAVAWDVARRAGVDQVVRKPFRAEALVERCALELRRRLQAR